MIGATLYVLGGLLVWLLTEFEDDAKTRALAGALWPLVALYGAWCPLADWIHERRERRKWGGIDIVAARELARRRLTPESRPEPADPHGPLPGDTQP